MTTLIIIILIPILILHSTYGNIVSHCHLSSAVSVVPHTLGRLTVPQTRTNYGDRSFAIQGPRTWNSLPADLRAPDISFETFRHKLKTFLFAV